MRDVGHFFILNIDEEVEAGPLSFHVICKDGLLFYLKIPFMKKGWGCKMLQKIIENEEEIYGWVVDKVLYTKSDSTTYRSPLPFYVKNGFISIPESRLEAKNISVVKIIY